jgi:hypothetical protein
MCSLLPFSYGLWILCGPFHPIFCSVLLLQREGKALPETSLPFHRAVPSLTHMALVELEKAGILKFVISQVESIRFLCFFLCIVYFFPLGI